ncbi:DUF1579 family protein [Novipirellula artificiosorum]|uniref:Lipocalin-like domain-containing protein n=1 Tax=Novipirellula artificiosorum TaxID=2528016 RepID=A0A5C6DBS5_9BACT|nr:DUF1579 family protein [Novipirellula artificiosorum]TWU33237.1 hypothetical protein Poly41_49890 [Novipirellula artificiosorum]
MIRTLSIVCLGLIVLVASAKRSTPSKSTERGVLRGYVGDWDLAFDADDPFSQGTLSGECVLGGTYLEQTGELKARFVPYNAKIKVLTTYDANTSQYKRWAFLSNGRSLSYTGTWDPKTTTMVWVSEYSEPLSKQTVRTTTTEEFRDGDTIDVSKVSMSGGREVGRSIERRTRRK